MNKFAHIITSEDTRHGGGVVLTHNLGTEDIIVQLWHEGGNDNTVIRDSFSVTNLDANNIKLYFHDGDEGNGWRVVIFG